MQFNTFPSVHFGNIYSPSFCSSFARVVIVMLYIFCFFILNPIGMWVSVRVYVWRYLTRIKKIKCGIQKWGNCPFVSDYTFAETIVSFHICGYVPQPTVCSTMLNKLWVNDELTRFARCKFYFFWMLWFLYVFIFEFCIFIVLIRVGNRVRQLCAYVSQWKKEELAFNFILLESAF